jgi:hypothetical protein
MLPPLPGPLSTHRPAVWWTVRARPSSLPGRALTCARGSASHPTSASWCAELATLGSGTTTCRDRPCGRRARQRAVRLMLGPCASPTSPAAGSSCPGLPIRAAQRVRHPARRAVPTGAGWPPVTAFPPRPSPRRATSASSRPSRGCPPTPFVTGWAALGWRGARWFDGLAADGLTPLDVPVALDRRRGVRPRTGVELSEDWLMERDVEEVDGLRVTVPERATTSRRAVPPRSPPRSRRSTWLPPPISSTLTVWVTTSRAPVPAPASAACAWPTRWPTRTCGRPRRRGCA